MAIHPSRSKLGLAAVNSKDDDMIWMA